MVDGNSATISLKAMDGDTSKEKVIARRNDNYMVSFRIQRFEETCASPSTSQDDQSLLLAIGLKL